MYNYVNYNSNIRNINDINILFISKMKYIIDTIKQIVNIRNIGYSMIKRPPPHYNRKRGGAWGGRVSYFYVAGPFRV